MTHGFFVEILTPDCPLRRQPIGDGRTLVGRSTRSCALVIEDQRVSRVHLLIGHNGDTGVVILDMHSANGTLLEGRELYPGLPMNWLPDQVVSIGLTHLVLRYGPLEA